MDHGNDDTENLLTAVRAAIALRQPLSIQGGGSKGFYGNAGSGAPLDVTGHRGIVAYEPTELVLTARAGTRLTAIEQILADHGQMLSFEPPHFGPSATLGGTVACGLSGPRRPFSGSVRDAVLGLKLINGHGELLHMGGQVIKNVAGFDVARLLTGALGSLGVILEVSIKVLPRPETEATLRLAADPPAALRHMQALQRLPWPLSGLAYQGGHFWLRLAGAEQAVSAAAKRLGGDCPEDQEGFWNSLKEQRLAFFGGQEPLWRLSLPPAHPHLSAWDDTVIDWGGGLRWIKCPDPADQLFNLARQAGGHACRFRGGNRAEPCFQPLPPPLLALHQRLKQAFDPLRIFNRGRLRPEI
ncbi:MAG: glycolate oxidase subunit GlcE [Methylococcaceae bacterium]|nr:glycolate oxidase subunit GlcE [Methylococcaceae bacterium]